MTTPADELRTAAAKLRALTADATEGPWTADDPNTRWGDDYDHRIVGDGKILATFNSDHNGPLNAAYTATMHPAVGLALADWLDDAAEDAEQIGPNHHALAVARQINRSQPEEERRCPTCGHAMTTLGETDGEATLMCSYCRYSCTVLTGGGEHR